MAESPSQTSPTLLGRLRHEPSDQAAWGEFVFRYGPRIHAWCRQWHLQEADAQDVTQDVLVKLAIKLRTFAYDPSKSFRGWLRTVAHHTWRDFLDGRRPADATAGGSAVLRQLESVQARDDLVQRLADQFDQELLEEAMARVQLRVEPHTWEAFRLTALDGLTGAEAARRLESSVAMVFVAKSRVQRMIRDEVQRLDGEDGEDRS